MKLRAKFVLLVFGVIYLVIGISMVFYAFDFINLKDLSYMIEQVEQIISLKFLIGIAGGVLTVLVIMLLNFVWSGVASEKNIAFKTEYGEVLVSLSAIEDFVRKLMREDPDIRDLRTKVTARKKGLIISLKAMMLSEVNIPTITEKIQSDLRSRVQEMLGMEDPVIVKVYISKIGEKERKKKPKTQEDSENAVHPYREF
ncbi:MAG: alkaline shock response membrane anchor protein AmaP [Candidatus Omnitrophica bacterium]|nr:alkaline shock response membrane anchor protein AmaP [Candidatus Omnitrophota bacterium]